MSITMLGIMWAVIAISAIVLFIIKKNPFSKRKRHTAKSLIKSENKRNKGYLLQRLYSTFPIIKKEYAKVRDRVRLLYPADEPSINIYATKYMSRAVRRFIIITAISLIFSRGDLYFLAFGIFIAFVMFKGSINSSFEKAEANLLNQFSDFLSELVPVYREKHGHLDDALYSMLDTLPHYIGLHVQRIYDVIKSQHLQEAAAAYADYAPSTFLMSFVSLAVPTKLYGDKDLPDGNTTFVKGIMNLKKQLNEEILKRERIDIAFQSLTTVALVPVATIKPIEWFFSYFMPQTRSFFTSIMGTAVMTGIFIVCYLAYTLILSLKSTRRAEIKEEDFFSKLATYPVIDRILNIQYRNHYTKMERIDKQMKSVGDHTGVKAHMLKCVAVSLATFIVMNVLFITADIQSANNTLNNFETEFENTVVPNEKYTQTMREFSRELSNKHKNDRNPSREEIAEEVRSGGSILKGDDYVYAVADKVVEKVDKYQNTYFRWYFEVLSLLAAAIAFMTPTWILGFRAKAMLMSREDEVNSFNLLAMIFMDMDGIQVTTLLEWMERFSYYYRDPIMECSIMVPMGKKKALEKLRQYDNMRDFQKFVKCMINIDEVGFKQAFADIEIQQDYYNDKRKVDNERLIKKKKALGSRLAFIPMYATIGLWLILPMGMYALTLMETFRDAISAF